MHTKNRFSSPKADYLLTLVECPSGWRPNSIESVPPESKTLSVNHVASYEEALDDLYRINQHSIRNKCREWAVIQCGGGQL